MLFFKRGFNYHESIEIVSKPQRISETTENVTYSMNVRIPNTFDEKKIDGVYAPVGVFDEDYGAGEQTMKLRFMRHVV